MKQIITTFFISFLTMTTISCQNKISEVKFISTETDEPTEINQPKKFILKELTENSDFNYSKLSNIDGNINGVRSNENLIPIFEPKNGKYIYYKFIATFKGYKYLAPGGEGENIGIFHDILIIKTNPNNKIEDAYLYTLEWAEVPLQYDLLKSTNKNKILENGLELEKLKFTRTISEEKVDEKGIIYLINK